MLAGDLDPYEASERLLAGLVAGELKPNADR
jgi:hypothetical protein